MFRQFSYMSRHDEYLKCLVYRHDWTPLKYRLAGRIYSNVPQRKQNRLKFVFAGGIVLATVAWLAVSGSRDVNAKDYYVTISELQGMGSKAYTKHLRVAGNVQPGSINRSGPNATFALLEQGKLLRVDYQGAEPPPDTFKDDAQALAIGTYGRDGVFHATQLQAKCASKYAPVKPGTTPTGNTTPVTTTASIAK